METDSVPVYHRQGSSERTAIALIGDEEAVGAFLLAGWGQRRLSSALECNWFCVRDSTPEEEIEEGWRAFVRSTQVAVLLVSGAILRRVRDRREEKSGPTIVEIPCQDSSPRVTCSVYEPYSGWQPKESFPATSNAPADICPESTRVDELVAAVFRLATLGVSDDDDDDDLQPAWNNTKLQHKAALSFKLEVLNAATTEIAELLQGEPHGAKVFVRALNRQRTKMVDVSTAFPFLAGLVLTVLDKCMADQDVDTILTAMMLSQSYYRTRGDANPHREYLKAAIQSHPVWADDKFWREALALCVRKQSTSFTASKIASPRRSWINGGDDRVLAPPPPPRSTTDDEPIYMLCLPMSLRAPATESAERVALWSQLGGIVHAMLEFGAQPDAARAFADAVCAEHDLSRQQRAIILQHIESVRRAQQGADDHHAAAGDEDDHRDDDRPREAPQHAVPQEPAVPTQEAVVPVKVV